MTALGFDRFAAELRAEADAFASTVDGADLALRVPTCPEWTLEQLVHHVGRAYYWATAIITSATTTFTRPRSIIPITVVATVSTSRMPKTYAYCFFVTICSAIYNPCARWRAIR